MEWALGRKYKKNTSSLILNLKSALIGFKINLTKYTMDKSLKMRQPRLLHLPLPLPPLPGTFPNPHWPLPGFNWILMINAPRRRSFELPAFLTICSGGTNWPTDPAGAGVWGWCRLGEEESCCDLVISWLLDQWWRWWWPPGGRKWWKAGGSGRGGLPGGRDTWEPSVAKQKLPSLSSLDESKMDKGSLPEPRV